MSPPFRPICFVVMPFGTRDSGAAPPAPARVDFDAVWRLAIAPALEQLGYRAVRADQDQGALIIKEMLERLFYSDLVMADVSIPNANAYYEVGIRHAARPTGCVLIAADWARPVFDLAQIRHVPYPNPAGMLDAAAAAPIREALVRAIPEWAKRSGPMSETLAGYPNTPHDGDRARELAGELEAFETLRAAMATIRTMPATDRKRLAEPLLAQHPPATAVRASVAVEMVKFLRDTLEDWQAAQGYIESLPRELQDQPFMQEQLALALSKQGDPVQAIAALNRLIQLAGDSSERQGLLGGRYKKLYNESVKAAKPQLSHLEQAIRHYEQGMRLDLNDYYPSCNLPALYRERGGDGDEERAVAAAAVAREACKRSLVRSADDPWVKPTLLGLAFAERNATAAQEIARQVEDERGAGWMLDTTIDDLRRHVGQTTDPAIRGKLAAIVERLAALRN